MGAALLRPVLVSGDGDERLVVLERHDRRRVRLELQRLHQVVHEVRQLRARVLKPVRGARTHAHTHTHTHTHTQTHTQTHKHSQDSNHWSSVQPHAAHTHTLINTHTTVIDSHTRIHALRHTHRHTFTHRNVKKISHAQMQTTTHQQSHELARTDFCADRAEIVTDEKTNKKETDWNTCKIPKCHSLRVLSTMVPSVGHIHPSRAFPVFVPLWHHLM